MELLTSRTIEVTKLALDGLMERQRAISANTANAMSPDYQRKEVSFENQLKEIVDKDNVRRSIKETNSVKYNPTSLEELMGSSAQTARQLTPQQAMFLQSSNYGDFSPQVMDDTYSGAAMNGNNVELEKEMMDMAKVGTQYTILSTLEQRAFKGLQDVIKGQSQ